MIDDLRNKCNELLKNNSNDESLLNIKDLLQNNKLFFCISIEEAYTIFKLLGIEEKEYMNLYMNLVNENNF